ncbi:MAG TPA: DUF1573 domain-containing protein [Bacteroidales bacterium]|jgi:hypothetical protein|nr:DUF1573 domain-containing protein [Bacteroidales bacterium]MDD4087536.1 DUF1573 domain-containing protein [Bacteroidales bacterium]MDY0085917.1 DUF1573 domain-containing protein [Bacteroidales bacterium]HPE43356.1 DUF1573 domain-containing protein [Bacteroidales bacterium]
MKFRLIALLMWILIGFGCNNSDQKVSGELVRNPKTASTKDKSTPMPAISFDRTEHDFGKLIQGEKVSYIFKFKNAGNAPLLISKVSASCGCTASKYPKEPVAPGEEAKLEVTFDSSGQRGIQNKTITVLTNTQPQSTTLRLKAQVSTPDSY